MNFDFHKLGTDALVRIAMKECNISYEEAVKVVEEVLDQWCDEDQLDDECSSPTAFTSEDELKNNINIHYAFDAHDNPSEMTSLMLCESGLKPFYRFYIDVQHLAPEYDRELLEKEHSFAIRRAHVARDIRQAVQDVDALPNMVWMPSPSMPPDKCEAHEQFYNRIWSIDDHFWRDNMPCDEIDCHCYLRSTYEPVTDNNNIII